MCCQSPTGAIRHLRGDSASNSARSTPRKVDADPAQPFESMPNRETVGTENSDFSSFLENSPNRNDRHDEEVPEAESDILKVK